MVEPTHLKKYARQIGSFPQVRVENKTYLSGHHLKIEGLEDDLYIFQVLSSDPLGGFK